MTNINLPFINKEPASPFRIQQLQGNICRYIKARSGRIFLAMLWF